MADSAILTATFRVSFPEVFELTSYDDGPPRCNLTMLFDTADEAAAQCLKELKVAAQAAAVAKWGADLPKGLRNPFRLGEEKAELDGYDEGIVFIKATSKQVPEVIDRMKNPIKSPTEFYAGCYARAFVAAYAYDKKGKGVSFGLRSIQKLADGEPFGAGGSMASKYDELPALSPDSGAAPAGGADDGFLD